MSIALYARMRGAVPESIEPLITQLEQEPLEL
jgi:hypothetical protein